jgi:hypothetical protein
MKFIKQIVLLVVLFTTAQNFAQTSDLFRIEYLNIPNSSNDNSIERFRTLVQLPLEFKENNYIVIGGDYRNIKMDFNDVPFNTEAFNNVQQIEATVGYLLRNPEKTDWIYGGKVGMRLASNFQGKMVSDDFLYIGSVYAIRDRTKEGKADKPNRLILGLQYSTTPGRDFPLPIINYYKEFHPDWTYTLGVPKTNIRYKFNDIHHVQAYLTLDNFFANIQKNVVVEGQLAENISMTTVVGGLGYEFYFSKHILYYCYLAYTISNDFRLRNNEREDIYTFNDDPSVYLRTGIKLKI